MATEEPPILRESIFEAYSYQSRVNCSEIAWNDETATAVLTAVFVIGIISALLSLWGLFLNSVTLYVLRRMRDDSVFSLTLSALAICDICVLIFNGLDGVCHNIEVFPQASPLSQWLVIYLHPAIWQVKSSFISIRNWTVVLLLVIRTAHVCWPFRAPLIFNTTSVTIIVISQWILNFAIYGVKYLEVTTAVASCPEGDEIQVGPAKLLPLSYTWATTFAFSSFIPVVLCLLANAFLLIELNRSLQFRLSTSTSCGTAERRRIRLIVLLSTMFVVCQLPMIIDAVLFTKKVSPPMYVLFVIFTCLVSAIDSSCNFFVYMWANNKFKRNIRKMFGRSTASETTFSGRSDRESSERKQSIL